MSSRATPSATCLKTACLLLLAMVMAGGVRAQPANYPDKPVRIISDAAPGGAIDTNLRIIAEGLSQK
jgi:tripartite-type tricarboxylate transporter receptor subunit TctC